MVEWNVYVSGRFVGTVFADSESSARNVAFSDFDIDSEASISVVRR
jgi:hypothetical protein